MRFRIAVECGFGQRSLELPASPERSERPNGYQEDYSCSRGDGDLATVRAGPGKGASRVTLQHFCRGVHSSTCLIGQRLNANREPIQGGREGCHEAKLRLRPTRIAIGSLISFAIEPAGFGRCIRISRNYWLAP